MTHRNALLAIHFGALMFGLSGIFGKLAASTPLIITFGRAGFAVVALVLASQLLRSNSARASSRQRVGLLLGGVLLGGHWLTFFLAVKVGGVGIATLASPVSRPSRYCLKGCCSASAPDRSSSPW